MLVSIKKKSNLSNANNSDAYRYILIAEIYYDYQCSDMKHLMVTTTLIRIFPANALARLVSHPDASSRTVKNHSTQSNALWLGFNFFYISPKPK